MKHEILSWNTFSFYICVSLRTFLINKKMCFLVKFDSIKQYLLLIKQKQKKSKTPKRIWTKPCLETRSDKSPCANIFLELPLTNFGIILEWIQHHTMDHTLTFIHWLLMHLTLFTLTILTQPPKQNSEAATGHVLQTFANFTGKHLRWSLFFTKLQVLRPATPLKIDSYTGNFLWNLRNS